MIIIEERYSVKLPEVTSLFVQLNTFDKKVFDYLVQLQNCVYNKTKNEFEISVSKLFFVVDYLTSFYDVKFIPLPDWFTEC